MLKLHNIKKRPGSTKRRKVVGRGLGSGHGTYSTRGGKGQTARSGHSKMPARFEGGRQPLIRQLPKHRGFRSLGDKAYAVEASQLNQFKDGDVVTLESLKAMGIVPKLAKVAKVLKGTVSKKLTVQIAASASAKASIEQAGGSVK